MSRGTISVPREPLWRPRRYDGPMRIGASTYSREPFLKQIDEIREAGFDYAELDLTWITWEPEKLQAEAEVLAKRIPLLTAHLPPSQFHQADLARFVGFMDALAPVGTEVFNAHFLEARSAPRIAAGAKTSWLSDLVDAATDRDVLVTLENVDEPPEVLRKALDGARDPGNLQGHPGRQEGVPPQDATVDSTVTKSTKSAAGSHRLAPLAKAYWDAYLRQSPLFATAIGMRGYDDRLSDITPEGRARWIAELEAFHKRAIAIPEEGLRPAERTTWSELITSIRTDLDWALSDVEEWTVDPLNGPAVTLLNVESYQAVRTAVDGRRMVTRWGAMASYLEDHVANLRRGPQGGRVAVRCGVLKVIEQIDDLAAKEVDAWPLLKPLADTHGKWKAANRTAFRDGLTSAVRDRVRPAFLRL